MIDVNALFNKAITKYQVKQYLASHELIESSAVETNLSVSDQFNNDAQIDAEHLTCAGNFDKGMFDRQVANEQESNAYLWMAILTAKQEKKLGLNLEGNLDAYINSIIDEGDYAFTGKDELVVDLMRYFNKLDEKVKSNKTIGSFYSTNLQFWLVCYDDLNSNEEATHE